MLCGENDVSSLADVQQLWDGVLSRSVIDLQRDDDVLDPIVLHHLGDGIGGVPVIHPVDVLLVVNEPGDEGHHGIRVGVGRQGGGAVAAAIRLGVMMVFGYARIS